MQMQRTLDFDQLEAALLMKEQAPCPVIHRFGPGLYIREVHIPAGTFAVGHRQKREHFNVMLSGRVSMVQPDGGLSVLSAPQAFVAPPGRKVGLVLEDMVWQNIYATDERDIAKLEEMFLDKSENWEQNANQQLIAQRLAHENDRLDYQAMLGDVGVEHSTVVAQSEDESDQVPFPPENWRLMVAPSAIHGNGLFATYPIAAGEVIAPARIGDKRTPAGRFTNHAASPNARMQWGPDNSVVLVAIKPIRGCCGGGNGEEITVDYRKSVALIRGELA